MGLCVSCMHLFSWLAVRRTTPGCQAGFVFWINGCVHLICRVSLYVCMCTDITLLLLPLPQLPFLSTTHKATSSLKEPQGDGWRTLNGVTFRVSGYFNILIKECDQFQVSSIFRDERDRLDTTKAFLLVFWIPTNNTKADIPSCEHTGLPGGLAGPCRGQRQGCAPGTLGEGNPAPVSIGEQIPECWAPQAAVSLMMYFLLPDQLVMWSL